MAGKELKYAAELLLERSCAKVEPNLAWARHRLTGPQGRVYQVGSDRCAVMLKYVGSKLTAGTAIGCSSGRKTRPASCECCTPALTSAMGFHLGRAWLELVLSLSSSAKTPFSGVSRWNPTRALLCLRQQSCHRRLAQFEFLSNSGEALAGSTECEQPLFVTRNTRTSANASARPSDCQPSQSPLGGAELVGDMEHDWRGAFSGVGTNGERSRNRKRSQAGRARHRNVVCIADGNPDGWLDSTLYMRSGREFFQPGDDFLEKFLRGVLAFFEESIGQNAFGYNPARERPTDCDGGNIRKTFANNGEELKPAHVGHLQIGDNHIGQ